MMLSGLPVSPSFSQASEPDFEFAEEATDATETAEEPGKISDVITQASSSDESMLTEDDIARQEAETLVAVKGLLDDLGSTSTSCITPLPLTPEQKQSMQVTSGSSSEEQATGESTDASEPAEEPGKTNNHIALASSTEESNMPSINYADKSVSVTMPTASVSTGTDPKSTTSVSTCMETPTTANSSCQTDAWDTFVKNQMKQMFTEGMTVFGAVLGKKIAEVSPMSALVGVQNNLAITNQNLLQLAQCIENQNRLIRQERVKYSTASFIHTVKTLATSFNDMWADFHSFSTLPTSETQHSRTADALQAVVDDINLLNQKLIPPNTTTTQQVPLVTDY